MRALRLAATLAAAARAALQRAPCEHFIILKYAHTGSTWFVDELNGIDRFHVIEEFLMERFKESGELGQKDGRAPCGHQIPAPSTRHRREPLVPRR